MSIGWASDMIGWACAQPFPTLDTPLNYRQGADIELWKIYSVAIISTW